MKINKKLVKRIIAIAVAVGIAGFAGWKIFGPKEAIVVMQRTQPLAVMDLQNTVDVTGTVESDDKHSVYTSLVTPVLTVAVEVGDVVQEGDLLCQLDPTDLESSIRSKEATMGTTARSNMLALEQAKNDLYYAEWYVENDKNDKLLTAKNNMENAERTVKSAEYDLQAANRTLRDAQKDNRDARNDGNDPVYDSDAMEKLYDAYSKAELSLQTAEANYAIARETYYRTETQVQRDIQALKDSIAKAQNTANQTADYIALEKLKEDLADCTVTAPGSGTVTAVYASEGYEAKGLLFIIENTERLVVETTIKEFDVNTVKVGQKALIKSDATGDDVYEGEIISIAPASTKNAAGETVTGSTAEYAAKIRVTSTGHKLLIGMNVRLNLIQEQKNQVTAVLYDTVATGPDGQRGVYVAQPQEDGTHIARFVPVQTGMETDLYLEVSSPDLNVGDLILQDVAALYDGMPVTVMLGGMGGMSGQGGNQGMGPRGGMAVRVGG